MCHIRHIRHIWCHIRHINPVKIHPERITQNKKRMIDTLDYEEIEFPVSKNGLSN